MVDVGDLYGDSKGTPHAHGVRTSIPLRRIPDLEEGPCASAIHQNRFMAPEGQQVHSNCSWLVTCCCLKLAQVAKGAAKEARVGSL